MKTAEITKVERNTKINVKCTSCGRTIAVDITPQMEKMELFVLTCYNHDCNEEFRVDLKDIK